MDIPSNIPIWNLLTLTLSAVIGFIWRTLNEKIVAECQRVQAHALAEISRVETKAVSEASSLQSQISRFEVATSTLPIQLDALRQQLQRIELQLASTHVTKAELKEVNDARTARMDRLESILESLLENARPAARRQPKR